MPRLVHFMLPAVLAVGAACHESLPAGAARDGFLVTAEGVRLRYRTLGDGPDTVLLLHGGPGLGSDYLLEALAPLAEGRTLITYDQRGRGRSDSVREVSAAGDLADLEAVRSFFQLRRPNVIGHGWGAGLAAHYALAHPDQVGRLVLISPTFLRIYHYHGLQRFPYEGRDSAAFDGLEAARVARRDSLDPRGFCQRYLGVYFSPTPLRDRFATDRLRRDICSAPPATLRRIEKVNRELYLSLGAWDWSGSFARLSAPVLVVQGVGPKEPPEQSGGVVWRAAAMEWIVAVPGARALFLRAHPIVPWVDDAEGLSRAAATFLDGGWPTDAVEAVARH